MFSKSEATHLRQQFWTTLGQYLSPIYSSKNEKINWISYKTGVRFISFKMHADENAAKMIIEIAHTSPGHRMIFYNAFEKLKSEFENTIPFTWIWLKETTDSHGKVVSVIYSEIHDVNIFNKDNWPEMISFFKTSMIGIDKFWNMHMDIFQMI
ncbi:MAG: DUF4268 domain-containing protein [Ferruginibacter sp.]